MVARSGVGRWPRSKESTVDRDKPGYVPAKLRHILRGLRNDGTNDVAIGELEDDHPMHHVGPWLDDEGVDDSGELARG